MQAIDFEKANTTLGAGNNPNTKPLRIALCKNKTIPDYKHGFLVSKWEMQQEEKDFLKGRLLSFLTDEQVDKVFKNLPPVFLCAMHSMSPTMVFQYPEEGVFNPEFLEPDQTAADRVNSKRIKEN
jgi:hypothetical protein